MLERFEMLTNANEFRWFHKHGLQKLGPREVYFASMSARKKYLKEDERALLGIRSAEMFAKQIINTNDVEQTIRILKRFEVEKDCYRTQTGEVFPDKSLVLYFTVCPIDMYSATKDSITFMNESLATLTESALSDKNGALDQAWLRIRKLQSHLMSIIANSHSKSSVVDIDIDVNLECSYETENLEVINSVFREDGIDKHHKMIITSFGGYHILVQKSAITGNLMMTIDKLRKAFESLNPNLIKEIEINRNMMIPCPGTDQYGIHNVRVLNKEDFE